MKIRFNYVSNSSSSSFVIAYDETFFGDLISFFKENYLGDETKVQDSSNMDDFYKYYCDDEKEIEKTKNKIEKYEVDGKKVIYLKIDQEYTAIIWLLKQINENIYENKIEFIYDGSDW